MYKHIFSLLFSTTCLYIIASPAMMLIYDHSLLQEEEVKSPYLLDLNNKSSYMNWISISSFPSFVEFKFLTSMTFGAYLRGCHAAFEIITCPLLPFLISYYHILFVATWITRVSKILFLVDSWSTDNLQEIDKSIYAVLEDLDLQIVSGEFSELHFQGIVKLTWSKTECRITWGKAIKLNDHSLR